jgi:hypothetical protein
MSENVVNLFDMEADDASMSFLNKKSSSVDGLYRPLPKDAKDKQKGYVATIRFLPNVLEDGTIGASAIEKAVHYANLPDHQDLQGYYDSLINFNEKCPLTTLYWKLKNSKNQAEVERAELIGRTTKYYSYILVIEDEQHPELEGKILVFPYGFKIKEKINLERTGENSEGKKCNVFDPANGKDFRIIVKEVGGFPNYDSSSFRTVSPLKIWDETKKKFIQVPVEWSEEKQKNLITNAGVQKKVSAFLSVHDTKLEDNAPKRWSEDEKVKVDRIIEILSGNDIAFAKNAINKSSSNTSKNESLEDSSLDNETTDDLDEFFGDMDDDK